MSALQPSRIVLHCGIHKTGSTYLQRNLQSNRYLLLKHGILYLGPTTLKKQCCELWSFLQWGQLNRPPSTKFREKTLQTLLSLSGDNPTNIHTIFISFESIFGTLRTGLIKAEKTQKMPANGENKRGLYRYARKRTKRLIIGLEQALSIQNIEWTILFATRESNSFARSCYTQLIKEGHDLSAIPIEDFAQSTAFSSMDPDKLQASLSPLQQKRRLSIVRFRYEDTISATDPTRVLWTVLERALPEQVRQLQGVLKADTDNKNLQRLTNPGLSKRGLELATQARPRQHLQATI